MTSSIKNFLSADVFFQAQNAPNPVFGWGSAANPAAGACDAPPDSLVGWGETPSPFSSTRRFRPLRCLASYRKTNTNTAVSSLCCNVCCYNTCGVANCFRRILISFASSWRRNRKVAATCSACSPKPTTRWPSGVTSARVARGECAPRRWKN